MKQGLILITSRLTYPEIAIAHPSKVTENLLKQTGFACFPKLLVEADKARNKELSFFPLALELMIAHQTKEKDLLQQGKITTLSQKDTVLKIVACFADDLTSESKEKMRCLEEIWTAYQKIKHGMY